MQVACVVVLGAAALVPLRGRAVARLHDTVAVAVIVNARNTVPDPTLAELRAVLTLDRQFWPHGKRIVLFLPPPTSLARPVLLDRIYSMTNAELRRLWVAKLFRGSIPAIPATLRSERAVIAAVRRSEGAISAVLVSAVPAGIRILKIDGKSPTDVGYPLLVPPQ